MDMNTNTVKVRAAGSVQTSLKASLKFCFCKRSLPLPENRSAPMLASVSVSVSASLRGCFSSPHKHTAVSSAVHRLKAAETCSSTCGVYGSMSLPTTPAVTAKPTIIIIHTAVAAGARRSSGTCLAIKASSDVPQALTPKPIRLNASSASAKPYVGWVAIQTVAEAAMTPPTPNTSMPPIIQGVQRRPLSAPKPMRGRTICTA